MVKRAMAPPTVTGSRIVGRNGAAAWGGLAFGHVSELAGTSAGGT